MDLILVTYATRYGSTEEVAEVIAETIRQEGYVVDCKPMTDVSTIEPYQAVVLGSAVNYANWLPGAIEFVRSNQAALNKIPTALFTVHIRNLDDQANSRRARLAYLDDVRPLLQPVSEGYFAGKFTRHAAPELIPRWLAWMVPNFDFRKWEKIRAWANSLPSLFENRIDIPAVIMKEQSVG